MRIYPLSDDVKVKHTWNSVPENWQNLGHPPTGTAIEIHIALKAKNENALIDALYQVSSPGHPKHGVHLSREEVAELVAPPSDVLELANACLEHYSAGMHPYHLNETRRQANGPLSASYQLYQHIGTNDTVLRTLSYGLPAALVEHVQNVAPTTHFGFSRTPQPRRVAREQTKPSFLRSFYRTSSYVPLAADRNVLSVAGYLGDWPSLSDLREFMNQFRSDATSATYSVVKIKGGGYNPSNPTIEANLNMQYTSAIAYPTPHIFYSTGGSATEDRLLLARHVDLFAWLGVRGSSVLFSSGNDGVSGGNCLFQDSSGNSQVQFLPTFLSTCPWVTSVGGTTGYNPEAAASLSGGGFSVPGGRGVPDIALQAIDFRIVLNEETWTSGGTSCSTPAAAGIISLLNDYRISIGRPTLGFLNLWLWCMPPRSE
ncbi:subtilisin-like protein [Lactarius hatsudake]|nr:subtilisin-like protein [Lactarius hatsudake]